MISIRGNHVPVPRPLGWCILSITALAFLCGCLRKELVLLLLGAVLVALLAYAWIGCLVLGFVYKRRIKGAMIRFMKRTIPVGGKAEIVFTEGPEAKGVSAAPRRFRRPPGLLLRCEVRLCTKDERRIHAIFDPDRDKTPSFAAALRGAYFGETDAFLLFDAAGFFHFALPVPQGKSARLLVTPLPAPEVPHLSLRQGGAEHLKIPQYRKSDDLTEHRPYVPGDDPRRINWKLYSHGPLEELFVREEERDPPPEARLLVMVDSQADRELFNAEEARKGVDLLCESVLALVESFTGKGVETLVRSAAFSEESSTTEESPAEALAWPYATPLAAKDEALATEGAIQLKAVLQAEGQNSHGAAPGVVLFALPRVHVVPHTSALDLFLAQRPPNQTVDVVFVSNGIPAIEDAGRICVRLYNGRANVRASLFTASYAEED